jgi:AcrR family transcriptional regulator
VLLDAARACIERLGAAKTGLTDVALEAGVTRQTVYRYFADAEDLFRSATVLSSGGFLERMRARVERESGAAERIVECLVFAIREIPGDQVLGGLSAADHHFTLSYLLDLRFVQDEIERLSRGQAALPRARLDALAELFLRLLHSFLADPGPARSEAELRALLRGWLVPVIGPGGAGRR